MNERVDGRIEKKPRIAVVDENDQLIGYKDRDALAKGDLYRVTSAWITNSRGEILLAQRAFSKKKDPGKWSCAVAGTVDEGEEYDDNIVKEIAEEIGVKLTIHDLAKGPKMRIRGNANDFFDQWYVCMLDVPEDAFVIQVEEVVAVQWVSKDEIRRLLRESPDFFIPSASQWLPAFLED